MNDETLDQAQAAELRDKSADELIAAGHIRSAPVEAAFRTVPRHAFVPADTPLEITYQAGDQSTGAAGDVPGQCAAEPDERSRRGGLWGLSALPAGPWPWPRG
ncbi:hypothetical protein [Nonomuraea sp. B19D2]|uniref:hypothetical protein n=1 Tax=Nonomuraea sp. B19D2 TaxID=3159561 RepID=UPI0032D9EB05